MFGATAKVEVNTRKIADAADRATYRNLRHAAFSISKAAKLSIVKSPEPSTPGSPPTTRGKGGHNLRGAIFTDATQDSAIIGPRFSYVGDAGEAHEFGKRRKGDDFAERSFMKPALDQNIDRFANEWRGSIGE